MKKSITASKVVLIVASAVFTLIFALLLYHSSSAELTKVKSKTEKAVAQFDNGIEIAIVVQPIDPDYASVLYKSISNLEKYIKRDFPRAKFYVYVVEPDKKPIIKQHIIFYFMPKNDPTTLRKVMPYIKDAQNLNIFMYSFAVTDPSGMNIQPAIKYYEEWWGLKFIDTKTIYGLNPSNLLYDFEDKKEMQLSEDCHFRMLYTTGYNNDYIRLGLLKKKYDEPFKGSSFVIPLIAKNNNLIYVGAKLGMCDEADSIIVNKINRYIWDFLNG